LGGGPAELLVPDGGGVEVLEVVLDHDRIESYQPGKGSECADQSERRIW
jgi:hypothetical protein